MTAESGRRAAIVRLLETRDEGLPVPVRRGDAAAGFVHRAKAAEACPDCLANDRVMFGCETCGGRGVVEVFRERDPYSVSETPARYGLDGSRHDAAYARDLEIAALGRQLRAPKSEAELLEEANREPFAWERARAQMWRRFDYAALDAALEELRHHDPVAYRALHAVYVYGWLLEVSGAAEEACGRGLAFLSPRLAAFELANGRQLRAPGPEPERRVRGPLQRFGHAGLDARELRDVEMRGRAAAGASPAALAREFRVSIRTVYRVVNETEAA